MTHLAVMFTVLWACVAADWTLISGLQGSSHTRGHCCSSRGREKQGAVNGGCEQQINFFQLNGFIYINCWCHMYVKYTVYMWGDFILWFLIWMGSNRDTWFGHTESYCWINPLLGFTFHVLICTELCPPNDLFLFNAFLQHALHFYFFHFYSWKLVLLHCAISWQRGKRKVFNILNEYGVNVMHYVAS